MTPEYVVELGRHSVETVLMIASPMLVSALVVGLMVSIFQAATQINEQTMTFIPKIVAALTALILFAPWILNKMTGFTKELFNAVLTF